ncbi:unnamed protein product [Rotaria sp. Silwood2]|nr:unnamed protein product [Rotaria sp. Silwood2]CAF4718060.1 unnamed protein product [Rotaria sp. Silwood2]
MKTRRRTVDSRSLVSDNESLDTFASPLPISPSTTTTTATTTADLLTTTDDALANATLKQGGKCWHPAPCHLSTCSALVGSVKVRKLEHKY